MVKIFGWKKSDGDGASGSGGDGGSGVPGETGGTDFEPQPEKARKWFDHARTAADSYNHDYALSCYANGIKLDPEALSAHEAMYESGVAYHNNKGKAAKSSEVRQFEGGHPVDKLAAAEYAWMKDLTNLKLALKFMEAAAAAGFPAIAQMHSTRILNLFRKQKSVSKSQLLGARDVFAKVGAWNEAVALAEQALRLDPTDSSLDQELKDIIAQRAMEQSGYNDAPGEEGGFRKFIKDADKQRDLAASDQLSGAGDSDARQLERARTEYEKTPDLPDAISRYAQLLRKQNAPEARAQAREVLLRGYADIGEFRFKMAADDMDISDLEADVDALQQRLAAGDQSVLAAHDSRRAELLRLKAERFAERVEKYPTDRHLKFELGIVLYELGQYGEAMDTFQKSKDEPRLRVRAGHYLGLCFAAEDWHQEAISEFKEALTHIDATERERELDIRYDLMVSLMAQARQERSSDVAREAQEICSGIVRKNIGFRDIRTKRKEIDEIIKEIG